MEYVCNYMLADGDAPEWARRREAQGWHHISVADHFFTADRPYPHLWVTLGAMAAATSSVGVTTAFVNNLFRSPVEVAQAALSMQHLSGGRFELGLGAGWARDEAEQADIVFPERGERAGRFAEAAEAIRSLLHTGGAQLAGQHYSIDIDGIGPLGPTPPPLVASVGGPRTIREVTPHCDRVELKAASLATRDGELDVAKLREVGDDHLGGLIERVRAVDPEIGIGMFVLCNAGDDARTTALAEMLDGSLYGRFFGPAEKLVEGFAWLGELGIDRCQISAFSDTTLDDLAPLLF